MGPYTFVAKPMASSFTSEIEVIVCTTTRFLDKSGKQLLDSNIEDAVRVEEKLASVQVRGKRGDALRPVCAE